MNETKYIYIYLKRFRCYIQKDYYASRKPASQCYYLKESENEIRYTVRSLSFIPLSSAQLMYTTKEQEDVYILPSSSKEKCRLQGRAGGK